MSRADRRAAAAKAKPGSGPVTGAKQLAQRLAAAKLPGTPPEIAERARKALRALVESAQRSGMALPDLIAGLASGRAAVTVAGVEAEQARARGADPMQGAACAQGCAFCCILSGEDGGTITEHEAERLAAALAPLAGVPDGRAWHPRACPALDPGTRMCRAYDARPMLCRSYHSTDPTACEAHTRGEAAVGARLAGGHLSYLAAHGLARAALKGHRRVDTYPLWDVAAAAVEGRDWRATRHGSGALDAERRRTGRAALSALRGRPE